MIRGSGAITARRGTLTGVKVTGSVSVRTYQDLILSGARSMCGGELAICLTDTAAVRARSLSLHEGDVGGRTVADPALSASRRLEAFDDAVDGGYRIGVPLSAEASLVTSRRAHRQDWC